MLDSIFSNITIFKWQMAVHFVTCYSVIIILLALGVRAKCVENTKVAFAVYACICYLLVQFIVVAAISANIEGYMRYSDSNLHMMMDFLWSPMVSSVCVWLFITNVVKQCRLCVVDIPRRAIHARISYRKILAYMAIGVCSILMLYPVDIIFGARLNEDLLIRILTAFSAIGVVCELFYSRAKTNTISMTSVTWSWFVGTWIGAAIVTLF